MSNGSLVAQSSIGWGLLLVLHFRFLSLLPLLLAAVLPTAHPSAASPESDLSIVVVDDGQNGGAAQVAAHWTGSLPVRLVPTRLAGSGTPVPASQAILLDDPMSLVELRRGRLDESLSVVGRDGNILATTSIAGSSFGWQSEFFGPGVNGAIHTALVHDGELIVAGDFDAAGAINAVSIARWDGAQWQSYGDVLTQPTNPGISINDLAIYQDDLYIGGEFQQIGDREFNGVARWDGSAWQPLTGSSGTGVWREAGYLSDVRAFAVYEGDLIVGGLFDRAGGLEVSNLARWNGDTWQPVSGAAGGGLTSSEDGPNGPVYALHNFEGELIVGGAFDAAGGVLACKVARLHDGLWRPLREETGGPCLNHVSSMTRLGPDLILGGERWLKSWDGQSLADFPSDPGADYYPEHLQDLIQWNSELYASGEFRKTLDPLDRLKGLLRWTGEAWQHVKTADGTVLDSVNRTKALANYEGQLVLGGYLSSMAGLGVNGVALFDGQVPQNLEAGTGTGILSGGVTTSTIWKGNLVVGGSFVWAGSETVNHVALWDGANWQGLGENGSYGVSRQDAEAKVHDLQVLGDDLIVAGEFEQAGGVWSRNIARYGSEGWSPMTAFDLFTGPTYALGLWDGDLVAVSSRPNASGYPIEFHVVRMIGSDWHRLHASGSAGFSERIRDLTAYQGDLYAGGDFTWVDGQPVEYVARFEQGEWRNPSPASGDGPDSSVWTMLRFEDDLIVAGSFSEVGEVDAEAIVRWDGQSWNPIQSPSNFLGNVDVIRAISVIDGRIHATGRFERSSDLHYVARFDEDGWWPLGPGGSGPEFIPTTLVKWMGSPLVAGYFERVGGFPAWGLARFVREPSSTEIVELVPGGGQDYPYLHGAVVTASVTGVEGPPESGFIKVVSDAGEYCETSLEQDADAATEYRCAIEYEGSGPRELTAIFSRSPTHKNSESAPVSTLARYETTTEITEISPDRVQATGQPIEVNVAFSGGVNPTGTVEISVGSDSSCSVPLQDGQCSLSHDGSGWIDVTASYAGDDANRGSWDSREYYINPGSLTLLPSRLDFGSVGLGQQSDPRTMRVSNPTDEPVEIWGISGAEAPFHESDGGTCVPTPVTLSPGEACALVYRFSPLSNQEYIQSVEIYLSPDNVPHLFYQYGFGQDVIFGDSFWAAEN